MSKTLNLVDIDKSDIKYQIQKFPDGQQNIVIKSSVNHNIPMANGIGLSDIKKYPIQIKSRLNNWLDLELIVCTVASLRILKVKEIHLYVPYILGARSDRKFEHGGNRYIKDVIAPVLNSLNFESVTCIDPHSYVLENCINNFESITNKELVMKVFDNGWNSLKMSECVLISPDAGASHKIYKLAEQIGYKGDIITCSKERDANGKLTNISLMNLPKDAWTKDLIIVDDICDGGQTFINIAKHFKENYGDLKGKIYLIITHGIFSKGFHELCDYFDGIYCTNSYSNTLAPLEKGTMSGVHTSMKKGIINRADNVFVKQLNVF
jgi:ribose-phosphate pyrophosphokinase